MVGRLTITTFEKIVIATLGVSEIVASVKKSQADVVVAIVVVVPKNVEIVVKGIAGVGSKFRSAYMME